MLKMLKRAFLLCPPSPEYVMLTAAVIGCGPAGMQMAARLRQKGPMVTCFDIAPEAGGIWNGNGHDNFTPRGLLAPIYSSMRCVLPKDFMSFSDTRMDFTAPQFPHHTYVRGYLHHVAEVKGIRAMTRFNTKVESCRFDDGQRCWKLISVNVANGDVMEWSFDRVAVCTGQHHKPRFPADWKMTLSEFLESGGEVGHSAHVKNFRQFRHKNVVVVGDGVGAYDCMRELIRNGASVTHSSLLRLEMDPSTAGIGEGLLALQGIGGAVGMNARQVAAGAGASRDVTSWLFSAVTRWLPFLSRATEHHTNEVVTRWLRHQNHELLKVPRVGKITGSVGKQLLVEDDATRKRTKSDVIDEALQRGLSSSHRPKGAAEDEGALSPHTLMSEVDAVIFATGYELSFPFLHDDVRLAVEGRTPPLQLENASATATTECGPGPSASTTAAETPAGGSAAGALPPHRRGLYLGTVFASNPTLAFVGTQRDLLPPFLMFEVQSLFIANVFSNRVVLPQSEAGMIRHEDHLTSECPELLTLYSDRGLGLHSSTYFNILMREIGSAEEQTTYSKQLAKRKWRVLLNMGLLAVHKLRSMAPLKRKKQHLLFSNKI